MRIKKKVSQHRRDFQAIYECEHCGHEQQGYGYDDTRFHQAVIPTIPCKGCGKTADPATPKTAPDVPAHVEL